MTQQPLSPEESARFQAVVEADAKQAAARASADVLRIGADRDARIAVLRLVIVGTALVLVVGATTLLTLLVPKWPTEATASILTGVAMLVMRILEKNGDKQ